MLITPSAEHPVFDDELIKARRFSYIITSRPSGLVSGDISTAGGMPAPKNWQRTSKKHVPLTHSLILTERSTRGDPNNDIVPVESTRGSVPIDLDKWSRDFLFMVELNKQ